MHPSHSKQSEALVTHSERVEKANEEEVDATASTQQPTMAPLTFVRGFFSHNDAVSVTAANGDVGAPVRMGLAEGKTWADVNELIDNSETHGGPKVKLVLLLRHGEGLHNADKARVGDQAWENEYQFLPEYIDAPLTALGVVQSNAAATVLEDQLSTGGLQLERVIVSPLDRTLETYAHAFMNLPHIPATVMEITRETLGVCPCDQRKAMRDKLARYPQIDFSGVKDEEDVLWQADHRESDAEIEVRALRFLNEVYWDHSESRVAVVSHSGFSRACFRALGHRHYRPQNAEFIPLLLTSEPAPSAHQ